MSDDFVRLIAENFENLSGNSLQKLSRTLERKGFSLKERFFPPPSGPMGENCPESLDSQDFFTLLERTLKNPSDEDTLQELSQEVFRRTRTSPKHHSLYCICYIFPEELEELVQKLRIKKWNLEVKYPRYDSERFPIFHVLEGDIGGGVPLQSSILRSAFGVEDSRRLLEFILEQRENIHE